LRCSLAGISRSSSIVDFLAQGGHGARVVKLRPDGEDPREHRIVEIKLVHQVRRRTGVEFRVARNEQVERERAPGGGRVGHDFENAFADAGGIGLRGDLRDGRLLGHAAGAGEQFGQLGVADARAGGRKRLAPAVAVRRVRRGSG